jgi:hypothetical protein
MTTRNPFARKRLRTAEFRFEVEDSAGPRAALAEAKQRLVLAGIGKSGDTASQQAQVDAAQKAYDECFEIVRFRQNTGAIELLEQSRVDRGEDERPDGYLWWTDPDSFEIGLIIASAVDVDLTAEQWVAELAEPRWTIQDRKALLGAAYEANVRVAYDVGKG